MQEVFDIKIWDRNEFNLIVFNVPINYKVKIISIWLNKAIYNSLRKSYPMILRLSSSNIIIAAFCVIYFS